MWLLHHVYTHRGCTDKKRVDMHTVKVKRVVVVGILVVPVGYKPHIYE